MATAELAPTGGGSLTDLAERINREHDQVELACRAGLKHAMEAGRLLAEAKASVAYGEWGGWLATNCKFSERTASGWSRRHGGIPTRS